jgi:hypothetical protein
MECLLIPLFNYSITAENSQNIGKDMEIQTQEAFRIPNQNSQKRTFAHHVMVKMSRLQVKKRLLKIAREKYNRSYKGKFISITLDNSTDTLMAKQL